MGAGTAARRRHHPDQHARTLLRSDWIDAPDAVRYTVHAVIFVVWAVTLAYSIKQYRLNIEEDRRIIAEAERRQPTPEAAVSS